MKPQFHRLHLLCDRLADERITNEERGELSSLLSSSDENRREYLRISSVSSGLSLYAAEATAGAGPLSDSKVVPFWQSKPVALAATLMLLGIATFIFLRAGAIDETPEPPTPTVANVTAISSPQWRVGDPEGTSIDLQMDDPLPSGTVHLAAGMAEVTFKSGARVVLQAPATFEILDSLRMRLDEGKLAADVSKGGNGFTVETVSGEVVDLGTGFGLEAGDSNAEVHTLSGMIGFQIGDESESFRKGEAVRAPAGVSNLGALEEVPFDASRWPSDIDSPGSSSKLVLFDDYRPKEGEAAEAVEAALGETVWYDDSSQRHEDPYQVGSGSTSIVNGLLTARPDEDGLRIGLRQPLHELAGSSTYSLGFEAACLLEEKGRFGLALGQADLSAEKPAPLSLLAWVMDDQIEVELRQGGEVVATETVPNQGEIGIKFEAEVERTADGKALVRMVAEGHFFDAIEIPDADAVSHLFFHGNSSRNQKYYLDDLFVRKQ